MTNNGNANGISLVNQGKNIAMFNSAVLSQAGFYSLRLSVHYNGRTDMEYIKDIYFDPTIKKGWPVHIDFDDDSVYAGSFIPSIADLDGNGVSEIIVVKGRYSELNPFATVMAYNPNGSLLWSKKVGEEVMAEIIGGTSILAQPVVADVNNDGKEDILVFLNGAVNGALNGYLYAIDYKGEIIPGWPVQLPAGFTPQIVVDDLNGDGKNEVIVRVQQSFSSGWESYLSI